MNKSNKDSWKKESEQLKKDLATRPKEVKKREVEIKFPGTKKKYLK